MKRIKLAGLLTIMLLGSLLVVPVSGEKQDIESLRAKAVKLNNEGNYKEAWEIYSKIALDPTGDPKQVGSDMMSAIGCLQNLSRVNEIDDFREKVIAVHKGNWRLLWTAARSYMDVEHYGTIIAGEFKRGPHRGGRAKWVNAFERDRVRALQLMRQATRKTAGEQNNHELSRFYLSFAHMLLANRGFSQAWRLQYATDLSTLPDYEDGYHSRWEHYYGGHRGAPVNEDGTPVYHYRPKNWKTATTDGQRWRWCLMQAVEMSPQRNTHVRRHFADFLHNQFGVQTMAHYGWYFGRGGSDDGRKDESGTYELHTLGEDETIARLASGIKRFKLPDEFNFIIIYKELKHYDSLAGIFENRRQYPKAADYWRKAIKQFGQGHNAWRLKRLNQIIGNRGQFEPIVTAPAGKGATVEFRFRNGKKVSLEAHEIKVAELLDDVKTYLKSSPPKLSWDRVNIADLGGRLVQNQPPADRIEIPDIGFKMVQKHRNKYVGKKVASWELDLAPRPKHFDKRITITTPLQKAGAYLLKAEMADGNTSEIIIWVADTAIVKKPLSDKTYYFVADATTGKPIPKCNVEFFGYRQEQVKNAIGRGFHYVVHTRNFAEFTDADGQLFLTPKQQDNNHRWVVIATTPKGRLAYLGWTGAWYGNYHDREYNATKTFVITDRPVYRPEHTVKFKFWVNHAKYDVEGKSAFAGRRFTVRVNNPKGEKIFEKNFTADEYGGFDGELTLKKNAALGVYRIYLPHHPGGGGSFRVEEYKKPEFEVKIEAPTEPVMLGEKVEAKITAKYYFGAPMTNAKVKYKVLRTAHDARWYPICRWDWLFGQGYWWYAYDYDWYPGWSKWGCERPLPYWWWRWHRPVQPEVVAEAEVPVGADGTVKVLIDTAVAKAIHGDRDHKYSITAEVTDQSRRTIVGTGSVLVARKPFKVHAWVDRGYYRVGDTVRASFKARRLDGKSVKGDGKLTLYRITYKDNKPVETAVREWNLDTDDEGASSIQMKASRAGQYRLSYKVTDAKEHTIEGGYIFCIRGEGFDGSEFRFNDIEILPDKGEYKPGEKVRLMLNTNRAGSTILLFIRPSNGVYLPPKVLHLNGKSLTEEIEIIKKDMPNFFVEAVTVSGAKVHREARQIVVPPEKRVIDVKVTPSSAEYKPGEKAKVKIKLTDPTGEPIAGSVVVAIYDKAVEYISGGSNVPEIKEFFWKWRRRHWPQGETSLSKGGYNLTRKNKVRMSFIGVFGQSVADEGLPDTQSLERVGGLTRDKLQFGSGAIRVEAKVLDAAESGAPRLAFAKGKIAEESGGEASQPPGVEPVVRTKFADTALWAGALTAGADGLAEVKLTMPENLTTWKTRVWAMGYGTRCGEGTAEVVTTKDLIIRLQAPRFFVQKDEVVLSANVHNYLKEKKKVQVLLELDGDCLVVRETEHLAPANGPDGKPLPQPWAEKTTTRPNAQIVEIDSKGEKRVDWRVKVVKEGTATITMKAITDEESDAMQMSFPVYVHGMLKTESFCGVIRPKESDSTINIRVPKERLPDQSRLEIRYSPTLAGAMVDALPYLSSYPYGCTEQTLNRFIPTVITHKVLMRMGLDLKDIRDKRTNLNAQEIGKDPERAKQWKRYKHEAVYDEAAVRDMVQAGLERLASMQCGDGGWGWFSGWGERSYPHTTAVVVHGLQIARENDVAVVPGMLNRGVEWLKRYQNEQVRLIKNGRKDPKVKPWKRHADNLDALVYMVLVDEKIDNKEMREFLYEDRNHLAVYAKSMFGVAAHKVGDKEKRDMLIRNIEQYLVEDDENQTAYLRLPNKGYWWCWYGSEYEAHAYYLKLLAVTDPKGRKASRLVKYLLNNRKHATYWNSTRDTALCIEAFADYIKASGEDKPDMTVRILIDGKKVKEVKINSENIFSFDNQLLLEGDAVTTGEHKIEMRKVGAGPLYFNAYLTNFTLEDPITRAGLEIKVNRKYFKLVRVDKKIKVEGSRGQAVDQKVEKYERKELKNLDMLTSGDLVEIELVIESKNDYEYIILEDMKAAGFEPVALRSGYGGNEMGAYMELRDERVVFFVRRLARGRHSLSYRMRAEIPGRFSALPTKASAMYAPELKANSDEIKLQIKD
ncbi:MAG: MG2 domain-containing protein [Planctomycetota bacterium]|nr:MG2 domain-containing protein [Planctomycetota bacterium]